MDDKRFNEMVDAMSEAELFAQSPIAAAMRAAGYSDHDIMIALMRESLRIQRRCASIVARCATPTKFIIAPLPHSTEEPRHG